MDTWLAETTFTVTRVYCGYPAHEAGLRAGDRILAVNGRAFGQPGVARLGERRIGIESVMTFQRGDEELEISMISVARPSAGG